VLKRKLRTPRLRRKKRTVAQAWATVGMSLTFRAELMPGKEPDERTYTVARVLTNGRVELKDLGGQHTLTEFEAVR
jgi:hypothetical protein